MVRPIAEPDEFAEIVVDVPIKECIKRDTKRLYRKALADDLQNLPVSTAASAARKITTWLLTP